jgi:hypothetical protein
MQSGTPLSDGDGRLVTLEPKWEHLLVMAIERSYHGISGNPLSDATERVAASRFRWNISPFSTNAR